MAKSTSIAHPELGPIREKENLKYICFFYMVNGSRKINLGGDVK
jgi:hypothetical protein